MTRLALIAALSLVGRPAVAATPASLSAPLLATLPATHGRACIAPPAAADSTPSLAALYREGITFGEFAGRFNNRKKDWELRAGWVNIPDSTAARMRALRTPLRVLVVAEENCSDSMNAIPYLARLLELAPVIEMRVVDSKKGRSIMEAHRTPDGRAATPTFVVLDERDNVIACWVERPAVLVTWLKTARDSLNDDQRFAGKMAWYANDRGQSSIAEWVSMLEDAAVGRERCGR